MDIDEINTLVRKLKEDHYNLNIQVQMLSNAMLKMDDEEFDEILNGFIKDLGMEEAISNIIFPFLRKVGFMWQVGIINPAHEHFATHKIEQKIIQATYQDKKSNKENGKKYLLFLPPNENHEVGLLFAQYILKINGHQTLYLGQNLPFESLEEVNNYYEPDYVITVLTLFSPDSTVDIIINKIRERLGKTKLILAGNSIHNSSFSQEENLILIHNINEFSQIIKKQGLPLSA